MSTAYRYRLKVFLLTLLCPGLLISPAGAQTSPAKDPDLPKYDVASIRLNTEGTNSWGINTGNNTFTAREVPLKNLIANAFDIEQDLISGVPGPMQSPRFDITAKLLDTSVEPTDKQLSAMMRQILSDRFHLKTHFERKTLPAYNMVIAKRGFKLKPLAPVENQSGNMKINYTSDYSEVTATSMPIAELAVLLSQNLHRTVIDKTGLGGSYDFQMKWAPDMVDTNNNSLPSLFTAVEEQLGLKLESTKGPAKVLVIDHVEMPTTN